MYCIHTGGPQLPRSLRFGSRGRALLSVGRRTELTEVLPGAHPACAGPEFAISRDGYVRSFGHGASYVGK